MLDLGYRRQQGAAGDIGLRHSDFEITQVWHETNDSYCAIDKHVHASIGSKIFCGKSIWQIYAGWPVNTLASVTWVFWLVFDKTPLRGMTRHHQSTTICLGCCCHTSVIYNLAFYQFLSKTSQFWNHLLSHRSNICHHTLPSTLFQSLARWVQF